MYLLDTHAMLWYLRDSPELSTSAHSLIDRAEYVAVSIASFWKIAIKQRLSLMSPWECHDWKYEFFVIRSG
jgi:PIN domain nuclease of toxin-antitoxin system